MTNEDRALFQSAKLTHRFGLQSLARITFANGIEFSSEVSGYLIFPNQRLEHGLAFVNALTVQYGNQTLSVQVRERTSHDVIQGLLAFHEREASAAISPAPTIRGVALNGAFLRISAYPFYGLTVPQRIPMIQCCVD